ncbi:D-inositol-3-phosphate glycosyltransferase [Methylobacterium crusticola]|uniref:D-inositol-3-phosphate glycosyltransferase n=2 Tax=Methylobacterium crusticola TaxID=1697972 RepID=A0ABQ4QR65_9HYPH|nr:glycosyltransferase family 4 protein [Methylobacterium crusticola]GJD47714.1 D-inositol-3-phosphate glycosyltransferase [Methylobacterium crusticola]
MPEAVLAVPGDLAAPTGGYAYARALLAHLPAAGVAVAPLRLPDSFPDPTPADLAATAAAFAALAPDAVLLVDGLAYGALPPGLIRAAAPRPLVALVHHPVGLEAGLAPERAAVLIESERAALGLARGVVATSRFTARLIARAFGVPAARITVAEPGTSPAARVAPRPGARAALLAVGAVTPRKGYGVLVRALRDLADLDWRLTIAGALDRAPACAAALREAVAGAGLAGRVTLAGAVPAAALDRLYAEADLVVSSSLFEGYGMALAESLGRGLPVVATTGGAAAETVPDAAGLKVPPDDAPALAAALRALIADPGRRAAAAAAAWAAGRRLPDWGSTAAAVARALAEARR